ncbi:MAG TPA: hypothetical protein VMV68_10990 [Spirochaetia bacterium]|nr:hypothetical protein [Spirochaetia bacterium]
MSDKMEVLVKAIPDQLYNIFKGFCAMKNMSVNDGMIEAMAAFIEKTGGGKNEAVDEIMEKLRPAGKKK